MWFTCSESSGIKSMQDHVKNGISSSKEVQWGYREKDESIWQWFGVRVLDFESVDQVDWKRLWKRDVRKRNSWYFLLLQWYAPWWFQSRGLCTVWKREICGRKNFVHCFLFDLALEHLCNVFLQEKNWNLIEGRRDRLFLEYFIEPHIVCGTPGILKAGSNKSSMGMYWLQPVILMVLPRRFLPFNTPADGEGLRLSVEVFGIFLVWHQRWGPFKWGFARDSAGLGLLPEI